MHFLFQVRESSSHTNWLMTKLLAYTYNLTSLHCPSYILSQPKCLKFVRYPQTKPIVRQTVLQSTHGYTVFRFAVSKVYVSKQQCFYVPCTYGWLPTFCLDCILRFTFIMNIEFCVVHIELKFILADTGMTLTRRIKEILWYTLTNRYMGIK